MMIRLFAAALCGVVATASAAPPVQSWTMENGARVLLVESHAIPVIDISLGFDAGSRRDPPDKVGVAAMTAKMLSKGVRAAAGEPALTEAQVSDSLADVAALAGSSASRDSASTTLRTLSGEKTRDVAVGLVAALLSRPAFPEAALQREKTRVAATIKEEDTKPDAIAVKAFMKALYGDHPYGKRATVESVEAIARDDLLSFHRRHYVSDRAVIAMVGDITRPQAEAMARRLTQGLPRSGEDLAAMPEVRVAPPRHERLSHPASQAHILMGIPLVQRGDPDHYALTVGNYILGGGFVSRLVKEVREKRGLSYSVGSSIEPLKQQGPFRISLQTKKEQAGEAQRVVEETLRAFLRDGPTGEELKAAKAYLIGSFGLRIDSNRKMLDSLAAMGFYGLPLDYLETWQTRIARVTAEDVRSAFARKMEAGQLTSVTVGAPE